MYRVLICWTAQAAELRQPNNISNYQGKDILIDLHEISDRPLARISTEAEF